MRPGLRGDPARGRLLDAVITDGRRGGEGILQVPLGERLQERHPGVGILLGGGVAHPQAGVAVSLQFHPDSAGFRALRVLLGPVQVAQHVLDVVAEFVGHHVLLRQGSAGGTEAVHEFLEEARVEVCGGIRRAVERAHLGGCRAAAGVGGDVEDHRAGLRVLPVVLGQVGGPEGVQAVDRPGDPAVEPGIGVGAGLAGRGGALALRAGILGAGAQAFQQARIDAEQGRDQQDDAAADPAPDFGAAAHAAPVLDLRGVQLDVVIETHAVTISRAGAPAAPGR
ncbi:hypothetical protein AR539_14065 [Arthrobacter sp. EPSL27]|nr:hypothetical protein AR539_14065 [Arthrobacter sp. EPSL27]